MHRDIVSERDNGYEPKNEDDIAYCFKHRHSVYALVDFCQKKIDYYNELSVKYLEIFYHPVYQSEKLHPDSFSLLSLTTR